MLGRIHVSIPAKTTQLFSSKPHPGFVRITLLHFCISITNKLTTFFPASVSQLRASVTTKTTRKSLQLQHVPEIETENHQKVRLSVSLSFGFFWAPEFQFSIRNFESFNWSHLWKRFHLWYEPVNRIWRLSFIPMTWDVILPPCRGSQDLHLHAQDQMNRFKVVSFSCVWAASLVQEAYILQFMYVGEAPANWEKVLQGIRQMRSSADEHEPVAHEETADNTVLPKV